MLARLCAGDPLRIGMRCQERISERAVLVDPTRLVHRAVARIAYRAMGYRGHPPLAVFLRTVIDASLDELLREDAEREHGGVVGEGDDSQIQRFVADLLGVEPHLARRGALAFNALQLPTRAAFFRVAVDGHRFEVAADMLGCDLTQLRDHLQRAVETVSRATGADPEALESLWGDA